MVAHNPSSNNDRNPLPSHTGPLQKPADTVKTWTMWWKKWPYWKKTSSYTNVYVDRIKQGSKLIICWRSTSMRRKRWIWIWSGPVLICTGEGFSKMTGSVYLGLIKSFSYWPKSEAFVHQVSATCPREVRQLSARCPLADIWWTGTDRCGQLWFLVVSLGSRIFGGHLADFWTFWTFWTFSKVKHSHL